jgi:hypothetical protein
VRLRLVMPGTRVRPLAGPSVNLVPGIHVLSASENQDVDGRDISERSDAVLRTAMPGHDDEKRSSQHSEEDS